MDKVTPLQYVQVTGCNYRRLAEVTGCEYDTVKRWFMSGGNRREPSPSVPRLLADNLELMRLRSQVAQLQAELRRQNGG